MALMRLEQVTKKFRAASREISALRGISLDVQSGEFVAIMGASGSGKSTLLHLMAGLTRADSGKIILNETDLNQLSDKELTLIRRRQIGLVFQAFNLIPTLTARENIRLPLMLDQRGDAEARVDSLLNDLGLRDRATHRPDALSGGEQQRVAIGRALVADPAIILADEPTGNLDSENSRAVCELLRDLCSTHGKTIVMVTHEPSVAAYARRIVVLKDGLIAREFENTSRDSGELAARYQMALASS